jgi:hypothetical protein
MDLEFYFRNTKLSWFLYEGSIFFFFFRSHAFWKFCHSCLEIGTVKDVIFERLNITFHFLKGVYT